MIFTFKGYNTYIFDLNSKGKALILNNGLLDLGDTSFPDKLGIIRLVDNKVVIDIAGKPAHPANNDANDSYVMEDGDDLQFSSNTLHLHLNYNASGMLAGGTFTLDNENAGAGSRRNPDSNSSETTPASPQPPPESLSQSTPPESKPTDIGSIEESAAGMPSVTKQPLSPSRQDGDHPVPKHEHGQGIHMDSDHDAAAHEKLDQIVQETSVIESTNFADGDDCKSSDGKVQSKSNSESASNGSGSSSGGQKRERLDQFAR